MTKEHNLILAEWIVFRDRKQWTLRQAAKHLQTSPTNLGKVEKHQRGLTKDIAMKMTYIMSVKK